MHIFTLKETFALLVSGLTSFYLSCCSIYFNQIARSWSYTIYIERNLFVEKKNIPWSKRGFESFTIYVGRLLREDLFFKENNIDGPRMLFHSYFFIYNMVFDIIFHTLFIFLLHYIFYAYFLVGYGIFKIIVFFSALEYLKILDLYYYKKEKENWKLREDAIKKIKESNPHFFDRYDPIFWEKYFPQFADFTNNFDKLECK